MVKIYVDAGNSHNKIKERKPFTIGFFDETNDKKFSYILYEQTVDNTEAEYLAIINALLYCKDHVKKYEDTIIYSDSFSLTLKKELIYYCELNQIKLKWIKRNENKIADQLSKVNKENLNLKVSKKRVEKILAYKETINKIYKETVKENKSIEIIKDMNKEKSELNKLLKSKGIYENTKEYKYFEEIYNNKINEIEKIKLEVEALALKEKCK